MPMTDDYEPDWDEFAYAEGYRARLAKRPMHTNPHSYIRVFQRKSWDAGWCCADQEIREQLNVGEKK